MFVVIGWEDYVIQRSLMMMILLTYHIMNNFFKFFQSVYLTLSFWPHFLWHLFGPSSKGQSILNILLNTHAPARSLQKDDLWSIYTFRRLTCHHNNHWLHWSYKWVVTANPSSTNESELSCSHYCHHILQTYSWSFLASKVVQPHSIWSYIATGLFTITQIGTFINHNDTHNNNPN